MTTIKVPQNLSFKNAINFCNRLWNLDDDNNYEFNFANLKLVEPFTIAYVANEIQRFSLEKPQSNCTAINFEEDSFAADMGFYKAFGVEHSTEAGPAKAGVFIPLTTLFVADIHKEAELQDLTIGHILEDKAKQIAQTLTRNQDGDWVDTLTYSIREMMRNTVEHSESETIEYCAQYWPSKRLVEIALFDKGTGIKKSLSQNPCLEIDSDEDALQRALQPGISSKMYKGITPKNDAWQHSGYGLYMGNRICRNGGNFLIMSDNNAVFQDNEIKDTMQCHYNGTAIRLRIDTSTITKYSNMLSMYGREGNALAKEHAGDDVINPSIAATRLTKDFPQI